MSNKDDSGCFEFIFRVTGFFLILWSLWRIEQKLDDVNYKLSHIERRVERR